MTDANGFNVPDLNRFGRNKMRAAVWRGIGRTAAVVVVVLLIANALLGVVSQGWQNRGNHDTRFKEIVSYALVARHPGSTISGATCCVSGRRFDLSLEVALASPATGVRRDASRVTIHQNWRGQIDRIDGEPSGYDDAAVALFEGQTTTKNDTRALLAQMPTASAVVAVANLTAPVALDAAVINAGPEPLTYFFEQVLDPNADPDANDFPKHGAFSWPQMSIINLKAWANRLRTHDQRNLMGFSVATVKRIAAHPKVYAVIYERATPAQLVALLDRPEVDQLTLMDASLETDPRQLNEPAFGSQLQRKTDLLLDPPSS